MWVSISLLIINLGAFGYRILWPRTEVKITSPSNEAFVELRDMIWGTFQPNYARKVIWIIIFPQDNGRYYPHDSSADLQEDGKWSSSANIGSDIDKGKKFDIIAVVANTHAQNAFNAYHSQSRAGRSWLGLEKLPDGAIIYHRITVTRK